MSIITDIMPPVPTNIKPVSSIGANKDKFDPTWTRWFLQVKFKIDSINQNLYDLSNLVGNGFAIKNPDGSWTTATVVPVGSGGTGKTDVASGNYLRGTGGSVLEERTPTDVRQDIGAAKDFGSTSTSAVAGTADALPAQPVGYVEVEIGGVVRKLPYYD